MDTFKTCPLKYKFQEIDKIRAPKNIDAVFGSSVHAALKYMFKQSPLYPTPDQVIDFFRETWDARKTTIDTNAYNQETGDLYCKQGVSMLEKFYKQNQPWNFNVIDLESRFETEIKDEKIGQSHILAGIIDRIDKNDDEIYEIIDYKTARKMPGQKELDNDLQLSIYHLGLVKRWPHLNPKKIKLSLYFLKHREKISTARTQEQLEATKNNVLEIINEIQGKIKDNNNFPPTPSALCDWCGYRRICPMWKHLYQSQISNLKSQKEAEEAINEYFELKDNSQKNTDRLNELKILIYAFMDQNKTERVFGNEGYLTRRVTEKFSYDLEKIKAILEPTGKWDEILEPNGKKLEELLPRLPDELKEKINNLRSAKKITTLAVSRKKII